MENMINSEGTALTQPIHDILQLLNNDQNNAKLISIKEYETLWNLCSSDMQRLSSQVLKEVNIKLSTFRDIEEKYTWQIREIEEEIEANVAKSLGEFNVKVLEFHHKYKLPTEKQKAEFVGVIENSKDKIISLDQTESIVMIINEGHEDLKSAVYGINKDLCGFIEDFSSILAKYFAGVYEISNEVMTKYAMPDHISELKVPIAIELVKNKSSLLEAIESTKKIQNEATAKLESFYSVGVNALVANTINKMKDAIAANSSLRRDKILKTMEGFKSKL